ncbi:MAG: hypothetical protein ACI909_003927, partial [Planctomycetota bacterium]
RHIDKYLVFKAGMFRTKKLSAYAESHNKGCLVLTDDVLNFEMKPLNNILSIPVASITKVEPTNRLLGKNSEKLMLKVEFENSYGLNDAIALSVNEVTSWAKAIKAAKKIHV